MYPGALPGHLPSRQSQPSRPVKGSNTAEPPRPCTAPGNCEPTRHRPRDAARPALNPASPGPAQANQTPGLPGASRQTALTETPSIRSEWPPVWLMSVTAMRRRCPRNRPVASTWFVPSSDRSSTVRYPEGQRATDDGARVTQPAPAYSSCGRSSRRHRCRSGGVQRRFRR